MRGGKRIFELVRRAAFPALALIVVGTFAGHAIAGPNGILAWGGYHRALEQRAIAKRIVDPYLQPLEGLVVHARFPRFSYDEALA